MRYFCVFLLACTGASGSTVGSGSSEREDAYSSNQATLLTFDFKASFLTADAPGYAKASVQSHLLYTIGQLNGSNAVGRLDTAKIDGIETTAQSDGSFLTRYHVVLPVSWGAKTALPTGFVFKLPARADYDGYEAFTQKYKETCVDWAAHAVDSGSMWYYYRPDACTMDAVDFTTASASISVSSENTTGKYPEYNKVWEDGALEVVGIFGKFEVGGGDDDAGVQGFNAFVSSAKTLLGTGVQVSALPNDVTLQVTRTDGRRIKITALQVDNISTAGADFDTRYNSVSATADLIAYNGHAGLGQNVRALVRKGTFKKGQYQIVFMNGCDTFAYVDGALAQKKAELNPDDPKGTKYLDMVTNGMPAFFSSMPTAMLALVSALSQPAAPQTYEKIFTGVDDSQFVVVTGEEDNTYHP